jgi:ribosomal protein S27AE
MNFEKKDTIWKASCFIIFAIVGWLCSIIPANIIILITFLFVIILAIIHHKAFRCPNCGKDIFYNPVNIFGTKIWLETISFPEYCSKCGYKLK